MAIGLLADCPFKAREHQLSPGDALVMYADGVTEAFDTRQELFGAERLAEATTVLAGLSAQAILTGITDRVSAYTAGAPQSDDLTLVTLKVDS